MTLDSARTNGEVDRARAMQSRQAGHEADRQAAPDGAPWPLLPETARRVARGPTPGDGRAGGGPGGRTPEQAPGWRDGARRLQGQEPGLGGGGRRQRRLWRPETADGPARRAALPAAPEPLGAPAGLRAVAGPYLPRLRVVPVWGRGERFRVTRLPRLLAEAGRLPVPGLPAYEKWALPAGRVAASGRAAPLEPGGGASVPRELAPLVAALAAAQDVADLALFRSGGRSVLAARDRAGRWHEVWRWL